MPTSEVALAAVRASGPCVILLLSILAGGPAEAVSAPATTISPGSLDAVQTVAGSCPTFSWSEASGADGYELQVERLDPTRRFAPAPAIDLLLPAGASSWTPPLESCLLPGDAYTWSVRAVVGADPAEWSEPRQFEISERPAPEEVARAYEILRRDLEARRNGPSGREIVATGAETAPAGRSGDAPAPAAGAPGREPSTFVNASTDFGYRVEGLAQARDLSIVSFAPFFLGRILADGEISTPSTLDSPLFSLTDPSFVSLRSSLHSPATGKAVLCEAGSSCETGGASSDATLYVGSLYANDGLQVGPGGLVVNRPTSLVGTGGSGYFTVPSVTSTSVDNNSSDCPTGTIAVAVRLWETDSGQIGVQVKCSAP